MRALIGTFISFGFIAGLACSGSSNDAPGSAAGSPAPPCREVLDDDGCTALAAARLPSALPEAFGNSHAEDFDAAVFGFHVFFDKRFSKGNAVRCETCHTVERAFSDGLPVSIGLGTGVRNAPTIFNAARFTTFFWDGHADSLWSQPLFAFENPDEMGFTRLEIVHLLARLYAKEYAKNFGPLPDVSDVLRFPPAGKPGDAAFDSMTAEDRAIVDAVVANLGKALEAYMRKATTGPSRFDRYLGGETTALDPREVRGMYVFAQTGCLDCHRGPLLSDGRFHNLGVPALEGVAPDPGRSSAVAIVAANPFNAEGAFVDGARDESRRPEASPVLGGFRTPSLRNLGQSAPYGHNGTFATLEAIVDFHLQGGGHGTSRFVGVIDPLLSPRVISEEDRQALLAFLRALDGAYPALPWGQWPSGNG